MLNFPKRKCYENGEKDKFLVHLLRLRQKSNLSG